MTIDEQTELALKEAEDAVELLLTAARGARLQIAARDSLIRDLRQHIAQLTAELEKYRE